MFRSGKIKTLLPIPIIKTLVNHTHFNAQLLPTNLLKTNKIIKKSSENREDIIAYILLSIQLPVKMRFSSLIRNKDENNYIATIKPTLINHGCNDAGQYD